MKRRIPVICLGLALAFLIAGILPVTGLAAEKIFKCRMATLYPRGMAFEAVYQAWCDNIAAMSDGRLLIEDIYDGEGVAATEILSAVSSGLIEMGNPYMALHAGELPAGLVELGLPGGPDDLLSLLTLFYDTKFSEVLEKAYNEQNIHNMGEFFQPSCWMLTKEPIKSLDQLKKMKIRAPGAYGKMLRKLGAVPVTMSLSEVYTSLATGVVEGTAGSNMIDFRDVKLYEVAKYAYPLKLAGSQVAPFIVNMDFWKKLPDDIKAICHIATRWTGVDMANKCLLWDSDALQEMMDHGLRWGPKPSEADEAKWKAAGRAIWPEYAAKDKYSKEMLEIQATFMDKYGQ